ncbi:MAG TPA: AIPR family protein [Candidatus Angelobacter sp.]|nr:AIPR family protein [Candidatus Angelobacter sp.]
MDKVTETLLAEFSKEHEIDSLKQDKQFEHFASYVVVRGEHTESFDTADIIVGDDESSKGGTDIGIDGIAIIANGMLITDVEELEEMVERIGYLEVSFIFVQAETSSNFEGSKIGTFGFGVVDFFRDKPQLQFNDKVAAAAETMRRIYSKSGKFRRGIPVCKLFYVTTGKWTDDNNLNARIGGVKNDLIDTGLFKDVIFVPIGAAGVQKRYQESRHSRSAKFTFPKKVTVPAVPNVKEAYAGFLPWSEFKKLIIDDSGTLVKRLFFDNVRDWQGYNDVNSGIKKTLESQDKNRFVLMNNGATIIARTVILSGDDFTVEDYQIVNGCQTSHVLYDHRDLLDDTVSIPVRLISTRDEEVTKAIIKATNWQTQITEEQLYALEEFPKTLELFFNSIQSERLYFERRSRQYESASVEKTRVITFDGMIKAFAGMFLNEPHRTTKNYKSVKAKLGKDIFAKNQRAEPYYAAALAAYRVEAAFRGKRIPSELKPARFQILLAIRILTAGYNMPLLTANKIEQYCTKIVAALNDVNAAETVIQNAVKVVHTATGGNTERDNLRSESFTEGVIKAAQQAYDDSNTTT